MKPLSLVSWPNPRWKENPYQKILNEGLSRHGVRIARTPPAFWLLPHAPRPDWLHIHWPETLFADSRPAARESQLERFTQTVGRVKRRGTRVLWTMHNERPHEGGDEEFHRRANHTVAALADLVHVHFQGAKTLLEEEYGIGPEKVHVMQHPHYGDFYGDPVPPNQARHELGIDPGARVILMFGYLRRYKGVGAALDGFLATDDRALRLVVAGKPEDEATSEALQAAAQKDPRVLPRPGHVPPNEVAPLFSAADAFLFPSQRFFTSGSLMLALTYGLPVIAAPINHAATLAGRSFLRPWEPATTECLTQIMDSLEEWRGVIQPEVFEQVRTEWSAESLTRGLVETLSRG